MNGDGNLAVFCDFENVALGVRDADLKRFDVRPVLERLLLKGSIVAKKAYCDWDRYKEFKAPMHEAAFELIEIPHARQSGKNSADIRMVVDALDLCYTKEHIDIFVIISGDSDFSPLVSKLRENAKAVIGVGVKKATSDLLVNNCDEFIFYDDLVAASPSPRRRSRGKGRAKTTSEKRRAPSEPKDDPSKTNGQVDSVDGELRAAIEGREWAPEQHGYVFTRIAKELGLCKAGVTSYTGPKADRLKAALKTAGWTCAADPRYTHRRMRWHPPKKTVTTTEPAKPDPAQPAIDLVIQTAEAIHAERGDRAKLWGSMIKQTLKRRRPGFNESAYGFGSFNDLLEEAQSRGYLELDLDERSGGYVIGKITRD